MAITNLFDLPGFEVLRPVTEKYQINLILFGSMIRNLCFKEAALASEHISSDLDVTDLLDLVPFVSDIDMIYTGNEELVEHEVREAIWNVPFSEFFRWEVRSQAQYEKAGFADVDNYQAIIPANRIRLSTNSSTGLEDPWNGRVDIANRSFRYIRNPRYPNSPAFRNGQDLEIFSAISYFKTVLSAGIPLNEIEHQPGFGSAREVVKEACLSESNFRLLLETSFLRMRLKYLLTGIRGALRGRIPLSTALQTLGLDRFLQYLQRPEAPKLSDLINPLFIDNTGTRATSAYLKETEEFRTSDQNVVWSAGPRAHAQLVEHLRHYRDSRAKLDFAIADASLAPGEVVLLASEPMPIKAVPVELAAEDEDEDVSETFYFSPSDNEFLHFDGWISEEGSADSITNYDKTRLGGILVTWSEQENHVKPIIHPIPAVVRADRQLLTNRTHIQIRLGCFQFLEEATTIFGEGVRLQVFITGIR